MSHYGDEQSEFCMLISAQDLNISSVCLILACACQPVLGAQMTGVLRGAVL